MSKSYFTQDWGFCHKTCLKNEFYSDGLKKVIVSTLSNRLCQIFGRIKEKGRLKQVVNTNQELCAGMINQLNVTYVNYTKAADDTDGYNHDHFL